MHRIGHGLAVLAVHTKLIVLRLVSLLDNVVVKVFEIVLAVFLVMVLRSICSTCRSSRRAEHVLAPLTRHRSTIVCVHLMSLRVVQVLAVTRLRRVAGVPESSRVLDAEGAVHGKHLVRLERQLCLLVSWLHVVNRGWRLELG